MLHPLYRIYDSSGKYLRLIGTVEAETAERALEKATQGVWKQNFQPEGDSATALVAIL